MIIPCVRVRLKSWKHKAVACWAVYVAVFAAGSSGQGLGTEISALKQLSIEDLMEIEVTSVSRSPLSLSDAPSALQVITTQQIRRSGATNIPQALRLASNLQVAQKTAVGWGISARGFNTDLSNKLLVMMDGRTIYTPLYSGVRWSVQDYVLEDIDRIEVVSGPGGALWGANAVNGVINIKSKSAKDTQGFYGTAGSGNQLKDFAAVRYGGQINPKVHFRVYGKHARRDGEVLASGAPVANHFGLAQGGFRMDAETSPQASVTLQGDYYKGHEGIPGAGDAKVSGGNLLGRWSQVLANGSDVRLQLYYDRAFFRQPFASTPTTPASAFADDLVTYDLDFQHGFSIHDANRLVWGLGFRVFEDEATNAPAVGFDPEHVVHELLSGFVQDQFVAPWGVLTVGTKVEHTEYTGLEIEPNVRLQRELGGDRMVWGAVSHAVRTPSRIDRDYRVPSVGTALILGGRDFRSETVLAFEAGFRAKISPTLIGAVSLFHNEYDHLRSLDAAPGTAAPLYIYNDLEGDTHGVELSVTWDLLDWWRLYAGYTHLVADLRVAPGKSDRSNALAETSDPENQFSLNSAMDLPWGLELDAHLRWVDTLVNNFGGKPGTVPAYTELNVRLGFHLSPNLELSVFGQNLLHDHHPEFGVPTANRVEIRRSVFAKVAWRY